MQFSPFAHQYVSGLGRSLFFACLSAYASFAIATDWPTIIQQAVATDPRILSAKSGVDFIEDPEVLAFVSQLQKNKINEQRVEIDSEKIQKSTLH